MVEEMFSQIKDSKEKTRLISTIVLSRINLRATPSVSQGSSFLLQVLNKKNDSLLCRPNSKIKLLAVDRIIVEFFVGSKTYTTLSKYSYEGDNLLLHFDADLFRMERRSELRIDIPTASKAELRIASVNGKESADELCKILDISAGGCKILLPSNTSFIKFDDLILTEVKIPDKKPITLMALVRHISKDGTNAGLKFLSLDEPSKIRMIGLAIDLFLESSLH